LRVPTVGLVCVGYGAAIGLPTASVLILLGLDASCEVERGAKVVFSALASVMLWGMLSSMVSPTFEPLTLVALKAILARLA